MKIQDYQIKCKRSCPDLGANSNFLHMELGVLTEIGEVLDVFKKNIAYNKPIDYVNLGEELSDISWYLCNQATFRNLEVNFEHFKADYKITSQDEVLEYLMYPDLNNTNFTLSFNIMKIAEFYNLDFEKLLDNNINKLLVRFPDKFTEEAANNRNLEAERVELEK